MAGFAVPHCELLNSIRPTAGLVKRLKTSVVGQFDCFARDRGGSGVFFGQSSPRNSCAVIRRRLPTPSYKQYAHHNVRILGRRDLSKGV